MNKQKGFTIIEILVVVLILGILTALTITTLNPNRRMVKTEDAAASIYNIMRQARIQAITQRQFYGVVINSAPTDQSLTLPNTDTPVTLTFPAQSVSLVSMGQLQTVDEKITLTKQLPPDVILNASFFTAPPNTDFPAPERSFTKFDFSTGPYVTYFDPAGRAVSASTGTGTQNYSVFYFSSFDIDQTKSPTLLRAVTLYGATGGLKFWRFLPAGTPNKWSPKIDANS
jgi:prepilin-type N-terminal cleavage/methylation domain-containing protein